MRAARAGDEQYVPDGITISILRSLADGASAPEAAAACNVSESTLRRKLVLVRDQWGLDTTVQVIVAAVRRGLV